MADGTQYGPRGPELFMWPRNNKNHNISKFLKLSFFWDTLYNIIMMAAVYENSLWRGMLLLPLIPCWVTESSSSVQDQDTP